ncbi:TauD/TfdA dioxygenase family protein [Paralcaligenes ureilyticus]|uniref:Taurine dioxygenase n=1 Tax=Paralcaligenes ureilyticus TaxID=627131 RepID=A0A4R3M6F6_9BURK|nr:TauD/TfdA family dioxygenase [Paralcaligenes ureilyticus]TCT08991.1 taurine dioxygenase [Paralcaligenes ureilyticus]
MEIRPLTGTIGAELFGVDIAGGCTDSAIADIRGALLKYHVIFLRDQKIAPEQQIKFAEQFGPISKTPVYQTLNDYPQIMPVVKEPNEKDIIGDTWHTDETYQRTPPLGSILYAREVPKVGGDTLWSNLYLAYDGLSDGLKEQLGSLKAIHSNDFLSKNAKARNATRSTKLQEDVGRIDSIHPVVRTHEESGKKCLFVNRPFTYAFAGMSREESLPLLEYLYKESIKPENTCRFRWKEGSLAFWDNRCTMHYAINDYPGQRREMHRITIQGTEPI